MSIKGHTWSDKSPLKFTRWTPQQPDSHHGQQPCVEMYSTGEWGDTGCYSIKTFICKMPRRKLNCLLYICLQYNTAYQVTKFQKRSSQEGMGFRNSFTSAVGVTFLMMRYPNSHSNRVSSTFFFLFFFLFVCCCFFYKTMVQSRKKK